jgi:hypothetical protein
MNTLMKIFMRIPRDDFKIIKKEHNEQEKEIKENLKKETENNSLLTNEKELFEYKAINTELILNGKHKKVFLLSEKEILEKYLKKNLSYINIPKKFETRKDRFDKFFTIINDFNKSPPLSRDKINLYSNYTLELELPTEYWGYLNSYLTKEIMDKSQETELTKEETEIEKQKKEKREEVRRNRLKKLNGDRKYEWNNKGRKVSSKAIQELDKLAHLNALRLLDNLI